MRCKCPTKPLHLLTLIVVVLLTLWFWQTFLWKKLSLHQVPVGPSNNPKQLNYAAMSLLEFFNVTDSLDITWAHGANNKSQLQAAIKSDVMMLETDILLRGQGTANQTNIPVMAHPPLIDSDNTVEDWLTEVVKTNKGMKLDFKTMGAVEPVLDILNSKKDQIHQPVWFNMDILTGINTNKYVQNASLFVPTIVEKFPKCTLSLGWTTKWSNSPTDKGYTHAMMSEMANICNKITQPVTLPLRAAAVKSSWSHIKWLLDQSDRYTLTIWSGVSDIVDPDDMVFVRNETERHQVYYDLPEPLNSQFRDKLQKFEETS